MTQPRMVHVGTTYHVTRATLGRKFFLAPNPVVNRVFLYCLFLAASRFGVLVHSVSVESNHFHAVITDMRGTLSRFMHCIDQRVARNLIAHYAKVHPDEEIETIWSSGKFNAVILTTAEAVMGAIAYDLTNPVKDGLVADYRAWPGLKSRPSDWARAATRVRRPVGLYSSDRKEAERWVEVKYSVPPMLKNRPIKGAVDDVNALINSKTADARAAMKESNRHFLGVKAIRGINPFHAPNTPRVKGKRVPLVAAGGDGKMLKAGLTLLKTFQQTYRARFKLLREGVRDVVFPAGTYLMRERWRVVCDELTPPWCVAALAW